jgi:addiction module HigA family antidote
MDMFDPAHPGEIIREDYLKPLGLTVTAAAEGLGVTRKALRPAEWPRRRVARHGDTAGKGRLEHR